MLEKLFNIVDDEKILSIIDIEVDIWGIATIVLVFAAVVSGVSYIAGPDFWAILAGISWLFFMIFLSIQKVIERLTETKSSTQPE